MPVRFPRKRAMRLAELAAAISSQDDVPALADTIRRTTRAAGGDWWRYGSRVATWLESDGELPPPHVLFVEGNGKLPFFTWSVLPLVTCPGAGPCAEWCYSFRAWRYPAAFFRMLQNTVLERTAWGRERIRAAWNALPAGSDVRLYVDGDHATLDGLAWWIERMRERSDLPVYGYSKSWHLLTAWGARNAFPGNYVLNVSSGSRFESDEDMRARVDALPITRGAFVAIEGLATHADYRPGHEEEQRAHLAELRARARAQLGTDRVFACPGRCGSCMPQGHACGSMRLAGVPVVIAAH